MSVIVPATDDPATLPPVETALRAALKAGDELLVIREPPGCGPAQGRNEGAQRATGDVLVFVDADVVVHPDALSRLRVAFAVNPRLTAVFGSYDDNPSSPATVSTFRNLLHHHVHHSYAGPASTFWSGLGAVRREAFLRVGGFDVGRFAVPSVEDIDLGMRLVGEGERIELHPKVQGTHLKHWSLVNMVRTDFLRRGVPWVVMLLDGRTAPNTLNVSWRERLSTAGTLAVLVALGLRRGRVAGYALGGVVTVNAPFYWLLARRLGPMRAPAGIALHALHHLVAVASLPAGLTVFELARRRQRRRTRSGGRRPMSWGSAP